MLYVHNFVTKLDAVMEFAERHSQLVNKSQESIYKASVVKFAV